MYAAPAAAATDGLQSQHRTTTGAHTPSPAIQAAIDSLTAAAASQRAPEPGQARAVGAARPTSISNLMSSARTTASAQQSNLMYRGQHQASATPVTTPHLRPAEAALGRRQIVPPTASSLTAASLAGVQTPSSDATALWLEFSRGLLRTAQHLTVLTCCVCARAAVHMICKYANVCTCRDVSCLPQDSCCCFPLQHLNELLPFQSLPTQVTHVPVLVFFHSQAPALCPLAGQFRSHPFSQAFLSQTHPRQ